MTAFTWFTSCDIPVFKKEIYDVCGAGDTVVAVFTLALVGGLSFFDAARVANAAASVVVGKFGTATVSQAEIVEALA
jgi:D-beta-D-heptose 7-phosphate kinase/D-beta-D-heptose 1-phosphate adenosyltransferase